MKQINRSKLAKETKSVYCVDGVYSADRDALHRSIVSSLLKKDGPPVSGRQPLAILIGGGTASGKTSLRKAVVEGELQKLGVRAVTVDADEIKERIPEYEAFKASEPKDAARLVHRESCDIAVMLLKELLRLGKHFIYEGTMAQTRRYLQLIDALRRKEFEIHIYVVDVPLETALRRADERARVTGRKVPHPVIRYTHGKIPVTVEALKDKVDRYQVYDNRDGLKLIAANGYIHRDMYNEFLAKGGIKYRSAKMPTTAAAWRLPRLTPEHGAALREHISQAGESFPAVKPSAAGQTARGTRHILYDCDRDDLLDLL